MLDIRSMTESELTDCLTGRMPELPRWRCGQIYKWLRRGAASFPDMTDLPLDLRETLSRRYDITPISLVSRLNSKDGTVKYLWEIPGGDRIESVLMRYKHGVSVCVSSQAGCRMGCSFCASAGAGFSRSLTAGEMENEVRLSASEAGVRASGIVLMGIGEPLDNFDNVLRFIKLAGDPGGLAIGARHISLSTCGGVPGAISRLARLRLGITLSVSLHAPEDGLRRRLMPISVKCGLSELMSECDMYFKSTGRRISYEYALIDGVNDSVEMAEKLAKLLRLAPGHVNLIPLNAANPEYRASKPERQARFFARLKALGVNVTKRRRLGDDIGAACGQLRLSSKNAGGNT